VTRLRAFHAHHKDIIVKPLDGMGGMGIFRVREDELNFGAIIETVSEFGRRTVMAQRYIPEITDGDKRILLINGEPVPFALARIPQGKEIRGNLAAGGVGRAQPLSARDLEIAKAVGPTLRARGLLLVGIDVIGDYLTEVNVTSPTCFREIMEQSGFPVAARFIDALETQLTLH
jgi:glutathione synthase